MSYSPSEHDPFASPQSIGPEYPARPGGVRPPTGAVTAVAVLNYVIGAVNLSCGGLVTVAGFYFYSTLHSIDSQMNADFGEDWPQQMQEQIDDRDTEITFQMESHDFGLEMMGWVVGVIVGVGIVIALLGLPSLLAGYGVQKRRSWGRVLTIVLAGFCCILALLHLINLSPFALLYGGYSIYALVILLQVKHAEEFA